MKAPFSDDLELLIKFASHQAERMFRKDGRVLAMYHAICADGTNIVMPSPAADKDTGVAIVKAAFVLENVQSYVYIDEAWMVDVRASEANPRINLTEITRRSLKEHPDRREIVTYFAENKRGQSVQGRQYILRPEHGRPTLSPLTMESVPDMKGRMTNLLQGNRND